MKHLYSFLNRKIHHLIFLLLVYFLAVISFNIQAQTNPTPQNLSYTQNFETIPTLSILPTEITCWTVAGSPNQSLMDAALSILNGDAPVDTNSTSLLTGGCYRYSTTNNTQFYIQTSADATNGTNQLAVSIITTNLQDIKVSYDLEMISAQAKTVGVVLQYRIGTTGSWTTVVESSYAHNNLTRNAGQIDNFVELLLPNNTNDTNEVQLRWATWAGTETGDFSGIGIDNISITGNNKLIQGPITTCKKEKVTYFFSGMPVNNLIVVAINLPSGVTAIDSAYLSSPYTNTTIIVDTSDNSNPTYSFTSPSTSFELNYYVKANCETFSPSTSNAVVTISDTINGTLNNTVNDTILINSPWVIFDDSSSTNLTFNNAFVNNNYSRTFAYKNTSSTSFSGDLLFIDTIPNFSTAAIQFVSAIDSVTSGTATIINTIINDSVVQLTIRLTNFSNNAQLFIKEEVQLINCPNGINNHSFFSAFYGCADDTLCKKVPTLDNRTTTNKDANDKPILDYTLLTKGYPTCWKDNQERIIQINNTGLSDASAVQLWFPITSTALHITENSLDSFEIYHFDGFTKTLIPYSDTIISGEHWIITLDSLAAGDSLFFRYFEIIHCIDSTNYDDYFNNNIAMHHDKFPYVSLIHACNSTELKTVHHFLKNQYIWRSWEHDSKLQQTFFNYNGTLNGGDQANFEITSSNLVVAGIYGSNAAGFIFNIDNSEIIIELQLDSGLGLVTDSLYLLGNIAGVPTAIYPDTIEYFLGANPLIGAGDRIIARFAIPDSFFVQALPQPHQFGVQYKPTTYYTEFFSSFKVKFRLEAFCEYLLASGPSAIVQKFYFVPDKFCNPDCKLPLAKVEDAINIHCPGCIFPGWNLSAFNIQRTNFGFADNNNNNFPDAFPLQPANTNLVQLKNVMVRDTLQCSLEANTSDGEGALKFNTIGVDYIHAQLLLVNARMGHLQFIGATGTFTDSVGIHPFTVPTYAGVAPDSSSFYIDLSIDSLKIYTGDTSLTPFWIGNDIAIQLNFAVKKNFTQPYFNIEAINSFLFMSGTPFTGVMTKPDAFNFDTDSLEAMTDSARSELAFWCTGYEGRYGAIGADDQFIIPKVVHNASGTPNYFPCKNVLRYEMNTEVGSTVLPYVGNDQTAWNSFSYELRNLWMMDSIHINYPNGYILDSVVVINSQLTSDGVGGNTVRSCYKWTPPAYHIYDMSDAIINPTSATIYPARNLTQLTADVCDNTNNPRLRGWDEAKQYVIIFILKNMDCDTPLVQPASNYPITTYWSNFPTATNGDTTIIQTPGNFNFTKPDASLVTTINSFVQDALNSDLEMNITINTLQLLPLAPVDYQVNHAIAENTFLILHSPSGNVSIDSIISIPSNQRINAISQINNDSVYALGNVGFNWGAANIKVFTNYDCANIELSDSILIYTGWNCNGYPDSLQPLNTLCYLDSQWVKFNVIKPGLQASLSVPDTLNVCDTLHYDIKLTATGTGSLDSINVWLFDSTGAYTYIPNSGQLIHNGATPITPTGTDTLVFDLSSGNLLPNFEQGDTAHFIFDILPDCSFYTSTDKVKIVITATNYCGNRLDTIIIEQRPPFTILPLQDSLLVELFNDTISGCNDTATVVAVVTNLGANPTGANNTLTVTLPTGFAWSNGSPFTTMNGQTYTFTINGGIAAGGTQTIQFITSDNVGNGVYNMTAAVWVAQEVTCGTDTCSFSQSFAATTDSATITVINRDLMIDNIIVIASCLGDSTGSIDITVIGGTAPYTYSWINSSSVSFGTTEDLINLSADTYTVIITDSTNCSFTDTITVGVDSNCVTLCTTCTPLPAPSGILSTSPPPSQTYCINNNITVTGNVTLLLSEFQIDPNVTITVDNGAVLTITGSHLYACDKMWQGIVVKPGGRVVVQSFALGNFFNRSSLIEDAFIAIDIQGDPLINNNPLTVKDATFNRNEISIQITDYSTIIGANTYPMSIVNTVFTSRDIPFTSGSIIWPHTNAVKATTPVPVLKSPYINDAVYSPNNANAYLKLPFIPGTRKPLAGIRLIRVGNTQTPLTPIYHEIKIGAPGKNKFNVFDNLQIGVDAISSNFTCVNNVFQNNPEIKGIIVAINANALNLTNNRLRVIPAAGSKFTNRFYDVGRAINAVNYYEMIATLCEVRSSHISTAPITSPPFFNGKFGFTTQTNRFRMVNFSNNKMYNIENGISFIGGFGPFQGGGPIFNGQYSGQININNNTIRPHLPGNTVTTQYVANAISVSNVVNANIFFIPNSTINVNNNTLTEVYRGIGISTWTKKDVKTNKNIISLVEDVFTATNPTPTQYGIAHQANRAATNFGNSIAENNVTGFGITGSVASGNPRVRAIVTALCGNQVVKCNNVSNTFKGIEFNGDNFPTSFTNNSMTTHRYGFVLDNAGFIGVQGNTTNPTDNRWLGTWAAPNFKTATLATTTASTAIGSELWVRQTPAAFNPNGSGFSDSPFFPFGDEYYNNGTPSSTLKYVTGNPPVIACPPVVCCIGQNQVARLEAIVQEQEILSNNAAETRYINKNKVFRMLRDDPNLLNGSSILQTFNATKQQSNSATMAEVEEAFMLPDLTAAQSKTTAMVADNSIEQNYLTFFDNYLKHQTATLSSADSLTIVTLAMGCPFTDGEVVYQARALFNAIFMSNVVFEDGCVSATARNSFGFYEEVKPIITNDKTGVSYNLVPNYSFENYTACPSGVGQISLATPWVGTNPSSDYMNTCAPPCNLSVPCQTSTSYQPARTGNAIAFIWMLNGYGGDYREYLQVPLLDTLAPAICYKVTYYTNQKNGPLRYAVNNFGVYFSSNSFTTTWGPPGLIPQVLGFNNKIINDTVNWIEVTGIYTATGGESYLTIGNFFDDANTDTLNTGYGPFSASGYFFDDVFVLPIDSMPGGMPAYAGADTNVIIGDSVFIGQKISNLNCTWYDEIGTLIASNISGIYVSPTVSTYYVVEQNLCGVITYDTVNVTVLPVGVNELLKEKEVRVYPNPTTGELSITLPHQNNEWGIAIMDLQGRTVVEKIVNSNKVNLKLELENGVYLVQITNQNTNEKVIKKLVVQR